MKFRLIFQGNDVRLGLGDHLIGRDSDCVIRLDDPLVSRHHAHLQVAADTATIQDLGSRNGIRVNGLRVSNSQELEPGDQLRIGAVELLLVSGARPLSNATTAKNASDGDPGEPLMLLGRLADKALTLGNVAEAERILGRRLASILAGSLDGRRPEDQVLFQAVHYASELARHTAGGGWFSYVFELCASAEAHVPEEVIERLYAVTQRVKSQELSALGHYIDVHHGRKSAMTPRQRFVLGRTEGLLRLLQR